MYPLAIKYSNKKKMLFQQKWSHKDILL